MILEAAVINLTRNLDIICQQGKKGISSHDKLKQEALACLANLLKNAPDSEYTHLIKSADSEILLGYLLSILCNLAKDDKSKPIRLLSMETIEVLVERLELLHLRPSQSLVDKCSIATVIVALPGVSSSLFRTIMSDTKLPKSFLVKSIRVLTKFIAVAFLPCDHYDHHQATISRGNLQPTMTGKNLVDTCDNLATRIGFMLNYVMSNTTSLHADVQYAALDFCLCLLKETRNELVTRTITSIIRFMAFTTSNQECFGGANAENQVKLMIMTEEIKSRMGNKVQEEESIESVVLNCLFKRLDNLQENCLTMLISERESELAMLCGLMRLLPPEVMTTVLEVDSRKDQLLATLFKLVEFSCDQPFLFLTESQVGEGAVDVTGGARVYTTEKRFSHLTEKEVALVQTCCNCLGAITDWPLLVDMLRNDLMQFSDPNHLYIALQVLRGCLNRSDLNETKVARLTSQSLQTYREAIHECTSKVTQDASSYSSCDILKSVIAIETTLTLVELHLKFVASTPRRIIILKDLLCPLLDWSSSSSRAISEAGLNTLTSISCLYGLKSTKELIEEHTDYIVDGVSKMLDNFVCNPEVTSVLAITFKLSSIDTFYYFKDIYAQVFRVLAKYHHTKQSTALALLLYRTVTIIGDWRDSSAAGCADKPPPLTTEESIRAVKSSLDIDRIIEKLRNTSEQARRINENMENMRVTADEDEERVAKEIQSGERDRLGEPSCEDNTEEEQEKKERADDVILVERILKHCIGLMSSNYSETKILALKTAARGFRILRDDEDTLLPLVHQTWAPLLSRLTQDYMKQLEENLCAFECLLAMAVHAKDFIKRRTLDAIVPRLCLFLESQEHASRGKKPYEPYCMTTIYKCQLVIVGHLGQLAYHTQIGYTSLWSIIRVCLKYLDTKQESTLREAAAASCKHLIALDADCVWYFAKQCGQLRMLPFDVIFESPIGVAECDPQDQSIANPDSNSSRRSVGLPTRAH